MAAFADPASGKRFAVVLSTFQGEPEGAASSDKHLVEVASCWGRPADGCIGCRDELAEPLPLCTDMPLEVFHSCTLAGD